MSKSYRYDPDGDDGFMDRKALRRAKKMEKNNRRANRQDQIPAEEDTAEAPFDVMQSIDPCYADSFER